MHVRALVAAQSANEPVETVRKAGGRDRLRELPVVDAYQRHPSGGHGLGDGHRLVLLRARKLGDLKRDRGRSERRVRADVE